MADQDGRHDFVRIGISTCLLGEQVRYDGGHKRSAFINSHVAGVAKFVPVCPEVELGLGVPREPIHLVKDRGQIRLRGTKSKADHTDRMKEFAEHRVTELQSQELDGYILKKDSPSCGIQRIKVWNTSGQPVKSGRGLFAEVLMRRMPLLPVEEEGRLNDPILRESFFEQVFAYRRLRNLFSSTWGIGELVQFHTTEKLLLLAHNQQKYRELGRLVASAKAADRERLKSDYQRVFMTNLAQRAKPPSHCNVLQHIIGFFKRRLSRTQKVELTGLIEDFRSRHAPLVVPLTLIRHYVELFEVEYLRQQTYLDPYPKQLMLRNYVA